MIEKKMMYAKQRCNNIQNIMIKARQIEIRSQMIILFTVATLSCR